MTLAASACLLALVTALACAVPGVFVVLKGDSMVIDGIGHAVLPGIAVGYLFTSDIDSPWLLVTAAGEGLAVALLTEWLRRTGWLAGDAALGLVFPTLFAAGVVLISTRFSNVHLDVHAVLVGDLNLVAFTNPGYVWVMAGILAINAAFVAATWPRLVASTFDPQLLPGRGLHTAFMACVACTATAAFQAAGAMLVIALMVFPAITARLLTHRVPTLMAVACCVAAVAAVAGFWVAYHLNAATSAAMTVANAVIFALVLAVFLARRTRGARRGLN